MAGHEGRFAASHALASIGKIIEYQTQRRKRRWIPGVQSHGKPNDYINMFLEEMKTWLRSQLTLNSVCAEELVRREQYITKIKHDNYYWCFPVEKNQDYNIHDTVAFVHEKVRIDQLHFVDHPRI